MKILTTILLLQIVFLQNIYCQITYDLRKVNWGMTKEEVIKSELPLEYEQRYNGDLEYQNIEAGELKFSIIYEFKNGRLSGAQYFLSFKNIKVNCNDKISLGSKLIKLGFIFSNLKEKGFKFVDNWIGYNYKYDQLLSTYRDDNRDANAFNDPSTKYKTDWTSATNIDVIATKNHFYKLYISLENKRTYVSFEFNEFKNCEKRQAAILNNNGNDCNYWYFNEIVRIDYSPSYDLEKELKKSQF